MQARINQAAPAFAVLLGDNVYDFGSHAESDARFDPQVNPEAAAWMAGHVDWLGVGNHDTSTDGGLPAEQNYSVPIPVAGVTAAAPPADERAEHSFSWDYGSVHFVTFDTNALDTPVRLDGLLDWVEADLAASTARWKIVYGHHPLAGVPDKPESPGGNYYQQVVNRLKNAGVDLFMTGHSHTYSWTYPLTGQVDGVATWDDRGDARRFPSGTGLTQLVSGVGGADVRAGDYGRFPFVARGFTASSPVAARLGFSKIDVTAAALTVSYVAADDGAVIDSFRIEKEAVTSVSFRQGVDGYAGTVDTMVAENDPATAFAAAAPELVVTYVVGQGGAGTPPKYFVADASAGSTFRYADGGGLIGARSHAAANTRPRGVAASPDGIRLWVIDAGGDVFVYDSRLRLQGSWRAEGSSHRRESPSPGPPRRPYRPARRRRPPGSTTSGHRVAACGCSPFATGRERREPLGGSGTVLGRAARPGACR